MKQLSKYISVGVISTLIGYTIIFTAMYGFDFSPIVSNVLGYSFGLPISYSLNRTLTFESTNGKCKEFGFFLIMFAISYSANLLILHLLVSENVNPGLSQVLAGMCYVLVSFILNKYLVFKQASFNTEKTL